MKKILVIFAGLLISQMGFAIDNTLTRFNFVNLSVDSPQVRIWIPYAGKLSECLRYQDQSRLHDKVYPEYHRSLDDQRRSPRFSRGCVGSESSVDGSRAPRFRGRCYRRKPLRKEFERCLQSDSRRSHEPAKRRFRSGRGRGRSVRGLRRGWARNVPAPAPRAAEFLKPVIPSVVRRRSAHSCGSARRRPGGACPG